ncbi:hypothetical protein DEO72_LG10g2877 [Vigna unguiculata]|uniref:Uncharacterized protein n=1 Tax=Vigna unguiculata TaxID=3917 RepID=A0A4D6NFF6_VIGUN|nr:hypothetical protein DEO72_LG10g2877 [Vigna unguiculata]
MPPNEYHERLGARKFRVRCEGWIGLHMPPNEYHERLGARKFRVRCEGWIGLHMPPNEYHERLGARKFRVRCEGWIGLHMPPNEYHERLGARKFRVRCEGWIGLHMPPNEYHERLGARKFRVRCEGWIGLHMPPNEYHERLGARKFRVRCEGWIGLHMPPNEYHERLGARKFRVRCEGWIGLHMPPNEYHERLGARKFRVRWVLHMAKLGGLQMSPNEYHESLGARKFCVRGVLHMAKASKCPQMNTMKVLVHESFVFGGFCTWPSLAVHHGIARWLDVMVGKASKCPQMNTMKVLVHESFEFSGFCTWPRVGKAYKCPQMNTMIVMVHESFVLGGFCTWPSLAVQHDIARWLGFEFRFSFTDDFSGRSKHSTGERDDFLRQQSDSSFEDNGGKQIHEAYNVEQGLSDSIPSRPLRGGKPINQPPPRFRESGRGSFPPRFDDSHGAPGALDNSNKSSKIDLAFQGMNVAETNKDLGQSGDNFLDKFKLAFDDKAVNQSEAAASKQSEEAKWSDSNPNAQEPVPQDADEIFKKMKETVLLGCRDAVKKDIQLLFIFTMGKHGNKISFGGTEDIIGGVGRSPPDSKCQSSLRFTRVSSVPLCNH